MWIHRIAMLARIFGGPPEIFEGSVSAMVQVRRTKQAFEN